MSLASTLRRAARVAADASAVGSGDPTRIGRRLKNRAVAKGLGAIGFWRLFGRLWR